MSEFEVGHYAIGPRDGGSEWHIGTRDRRACKRCSPIAAAPAATVKPFRVTDPDLDAPDGAVVTFVRVGGMWEPFAAAPAASEPGLDVEAIAQFAESISDKGYSVSVRVYEPYGPDDPQPDPVADVWRSALPAPRLASEPTDASGQKGRRVK